MCLENCEAILMTIANKPLPKREGLGPRKIARHEVRRILRQRILSGECKVGSKLIQGQLAKDFGVSVGVIREALLELQAWGLVETHDNRGVFVSGWNVERLLECYDIREVLEGLAARLCSGRLSRPAYQHLRELAEQVNLDSIQQKWDAASRLDREFHHQITEHASNNTLLRLTESYRFMNKIITIGKPGTRPDETRESHLAIIEAIY
ncbi:MAG TPA: GntR family transcriptional regulator, partial [Tepidisphaeraceae bacterium]|nr:GntR family transcriptional regulator [Tepidisphaeraceae bacterium]